MVWYIALVESGSEVHAPSAQAQGGAPAQCVGKLLLRMRFGRAKYC